LPNRADWGTVEGMGRITRHGAATGVVAAWAVLGWSALGAAAPADAESIRARFRAAVVYPEFRLLDVYIAAGGRMHSTAEEGPSAGLAAGRQYVEAPPVVDDGGRRYAFRHWADGRTKAVLSYTHQDWFELTGETELWAAYTEAHFPNAGIVHLKPTNPPDALCFSASRALFWKDGPWSVWQSRFRDDRFADAVDPARILEIIGGSGPGRWISVWIDGRGMLYGGATQDDLDHIVELVAYYRGAKDLQTHVMVTHLWEAGNPVTDPAVRVARLNELAALLTRPDRQGRTLASVTDAISTYWVPDPAGTETAVGEWLAALTDRLDEAGLAGKHYVHLDGHWQNSVWTGSTCGGGPPAMYGYSAFSLAAAQEAGARGAFIEFWDQDPCVIGAGIRELAGLFGAEHVLASADVPNRHPDRLEFRPDHPDVRTMDALLESLWHAGVRTVFFWAYVDWNVTCGRPMEQFDFHAVDKSPAYPLMPKARLFRAYVRPWD